MAWDDAPPANDWTTEPPFPPSRKKGKLRSLTEKALSSIPFRRIGESVVSSPALPIAGGIGGALAGAGIASVPLAGLGAAGGEGFRQAGAHLLGIEAPRTIPAQMGAMGKEAALASLGEGGGQLLFRGGARALSPIGRKGREFFSAATGVPEYSFKALQEKPLRFLQASGKKVEALGKKVGDLIEDVTTKQLAPIEKAKFKVEEAFKTNAGNRRLSRNVALKMAEGQTADIGEVALANRAINKVIQNTPSPDQRFLLQQQKELFQSELANRLPELKQANTEFSKMKAVSQFRHIPRLNKSGDPSRLGAMMLAAVKNPLVLGTSPFVVGTALAAGAGLSKPLVTKTASQLAIQKINKNKPNEGSGFAKGGIIGEPSIITGLKSMENHLVGEAGPEIILPIKTLTEAKAKEYLKKAKGNKNLARKLALDDGYEIPEYVE